MREVLLRFRSQRLLLSLGLIGLAIVSGAGVAVALSGWPPLGSETNVAGPTVAPSGSVPPGVVSSASTSRPSPGTISGLRAERIQISRLGIDLPVVDGDGIDAPLDGAAHYPGSGWPDGGTNIYLYGHARPGLFLPLWQVEVGDRIVLTLADGSSRTYEVATIVPDAPWDAIGYVGPTTHEQLTLQTSTSDVPTDPRFIVVAYPAP